MVIGVNFGYNVPAMGMQFCRAIGPEMYCGSGLYLPEQRIAVYMFPPFHGKREPAISMLIENVNSLTEANDIGNYLIAVLSSPTLYPRFLYLLKKSLTSNENYMLIPKPSVIFTLSPINLLETRQMAITTPDGRRIIYINVGDAELYVNLPKNVPPIIEPILSDMLGSLTYSAVVTGSMTVAESQKLAQKMLRKLHELMQAGRRENRA